MEQALQQEKIPKMLLELEEQLKPFVYSSYPRFSKRGIPHLIIQTKDETYSICFFGKSKVWRIFQPYPSWGRPQTKTDFTSTELIVSFFKALKKEVTK